MPDIGATDATERRNAMRAAMSYNLPCDVRADIGGYPVYMKSRFFGLDSRGRVPRVIIEAPAQDGVIVPLHPGDPISLFFRVDLIRYTYPTTVLERREFALSGGSRSRALTTEYPQRMLRGQRREFYRITAPPDEPIPVRVGLLARGTAHALETPHLAFSSQTEIVNLSAGGLAFDFWEEYHRTLRHGDRILCDITLPNTGNVTLQARIVNTHFLRGRRVVRYGVEFVDIEKSVELKIAQNRLLRYVVDVQREQLAERSGLYE